MAGFKKAQMVDGYSVVQSLAQAQEAARKVAPPPVAAKAAAPAAETPAGKNPYLGKTVQPTKRTIRCFKCGLEFRLAGMAREIYCSKCHAKIDLKDYDIRGPWREAIQTGGRVTIHPGGRLEKARILAGSVIFAGEMDADSYIECNQWLEVGPGVVLEPRQVSMRNLRVCAGATVRFQNRLFVHHLEIAGLVDGDVESDGVVSVLEGGELRGKLKAGHLQVEEGGGLNARVFIWPGGAGR